jgi:ribonuclease P protein component
VLNKGLCEIKRKADDAPEPGHIRKIAEVTNCAQSCDSRARAFNQRFLDAKSEKFPTSVRIVRSSDYQALYKTGCKIHSSHFVLFGSRNVLGHSRLGITASRKVGGAVVRNRVKRLFREVFRRCFNQIPGRFDMVVNAKSGCGNIHYEELRTEFLAAVKKLKARHSG